MALHHITLMAAYKQGGGQKLKDIGKLAVPGIISHCCMQTYFVPRGINKKNISKRDAKAMCFVVDKQMPSTLFELIFFVQFFHKLIKLVRPYRFQEKLAAVNIESVKYAGRIGSNIYNDSLISAFTEYPPREIPSSGDSCVSRKRRLCFVGFSFSFW